MEAAVHAPLDPDVAWLCVHFHSKARENTKSTEWFQKQASPEFSGFSSWAEVIEIFIPVTSFYKSMHFIANHYKLVKERGKKRLSNYV